MRLLQRDPLPDLNLEPPTDVQAFVLSSYERMPQLPPVAMTRLDSGATKDRIYVDRSGAVRFERFASADATEPVTYMILSGTSFGRTPTVGSEHGLGRTGTRPSATTHGCTSSPLRPELRRRAGLRADPGSDEAGSWTGATGWRYVGADFVAGRPAHHLACAGEDLWLDDETRLILRVRAPDIDEAGNPVPGAFSTTEVTEIEFGEQPAALFALTPPMASLPCRCEAYLDLCPGDTAPFLEGPPCSGTPRPAEVMPTLLPEPSPTPIVGPNPSDCAVPPATQRADRPAGLDPGEPQQDWPAPVRTEPAGGAIVLPMPPTYIDPLGDTGSASFPASTSAT